MSRVSRPRRPCAVTQDEACDQGTDPGSASWRAPPPSVAAQPAAATKPANASGRCGSASVRSSTAFRQARSPGPLGAVRLEPAARARARKALGRAEGFHRSAEACRRSRDEIVGFVFAVNGEINSADVYPSNGLFRKMWTKLLTASVIEAIGPAMRLPALRRRSETVAGFLAAAEAGKPAKRRSMPAAVWRPATPRCLSVRELAAASPAAPAGWVHRNYLAR